MAVKVKCDCGCGREVYHNQLQLVKVDEAIDETLRHTETKKTFYVTRECKEAFTEELACMAMLQLSMRRYLPDPRGRWWLANAWLNPFYPWPKKLRRYFRRVGASLQVMRLQHAIYVRVKGFDYARTRARQSAILFSAPAFMQGWLSRRFIKPLRKAEAAAKAEQEKEAAKKLSVVPIES